MKSFETPTTFAFTKKIDNFVIKYSNILEMGQGGPEFGNITINDNLIEGYFSGPLLYFQNSIFIPAVIFKSFIGRGFQLARINLKTFKVEYLDSVKNGLIFLDRVEENRVYFFKDLEKKEESFIELQTK